MAFPKSIKELCGPSMIYFVLSIIVIFALLLQNLGNKNKYRIGNMSCRVTNTTLLFIVKIIYVLFWTYILNLICKDGYPELAWLLLFLPFITFFMIFLFFSIFQNVL
jgi:hypothetical protein